ncbi:hypothetical protein BV898_06519 [Hypsibius exemplaris]|uniref:Uncharacterized protein n=1 Tax=Hypsibius exemplaris TaxID=2072580 RepID=A0A1W0WWH2_HYPEX|nr:hypothetical protein BV898_06519 [Hypsibius exemplaris]
MFHPGTRSLFRASNFLLGLFGFTKCPPHSSMMRIVLSRVFGAAMIVGSLCFFVLQLTFAALRFFQMSDDSQAIHKRSSNSLITALEDFQSVFICLRGPVVLYMFFKNRHAFKEVERLSHRIVHLRKDKP